jgi:hypothetical protein
MEKKFKLLISAAILCLGACESVNYVPVVTPAMASTSMKQNKQINLLVLNQGRSLFVNRCIECHTLPVLWHYTSGDWIKIVNRMSHRASLKPAEQDAIVAYILAVKGSKD